MTEYNLEEFGKRVREIRKTLKISQIEFGKTLKLSGSFISEVEAGRTKPGLDFFYYVSKIYNVNLYYLIHGEGEMFGIPKKSGYPFKKKNENSIEDIEDLFWYMEHSPVFFHFVMGSALKVFRENEKLIIDEIEHHLKKKEAKMFEEKSDTNRDEE